VVEPNVANLWLAKDPSDPSYPNFESAPQGGITAWYTMRLSALSQGYEDDFALSPADALAIYEQRDKLRCVPWLKRFNQ